MVSAKRHITPPQSPIRKIPRIVMWKNEARSRFASSCPTPTPHTQFMPWQHEPNHASLLQLGRVIIAAGAIPPHSTTAFHSHSHNTFAVSVVTTPDITFHDLQPPRYALHDQSSQSRVAKLDCGACFSQRPFSSQLPFVHRAVSNHNPAAFFFVESSVPVLPSLAPSFKVLEHPTVRVKHHPSTDFWAAVELTLEPHQVIVIGHDASDPLPLARVIVPLACSLEDVEVQTTISLDCKTVEKHLNGIFMHARVISGFKDEMDSRLQIRHLGAQNSWSCVVADIFGNEPL